MPFPLQPPIKPMLAKPAARIPADMAYEPKWDGFRCLVFRDRDDVELWSRSGKQLTQYFPELIESLLDNTPHRCVLDGEIIIVDGDRLNFVALTERIHPAASRIAKLSAEIPASMVVWDVLALDDRSVMELPHTERRTLLERALSTADAPIHLTPMTTDLELAQQWFNEFEGAGVDGVIAKPLDGTYQPNVRAMVKVKHGREADCVVGAYKLHKNSTPQRPLLGSLQLGLYDADGDLAWVGAASAFPEKVRAEFAASLAEITLTPDSEEWQQHPWAQPQQPGGARRPGSVSRWTTEVKELHLVPPELVVEVGYDQMEGTRFRHNGQFRRWRQDKPAPDCTFDQLEVPVRFDLAELLAD